MNKRNAAKVIVAGMYVLMAPIRIPLDLIKCAKKKKSPARMIRNEVDFIEEILTNPDEEFDVFRTRKGMFIKTGKKTWYC